MSLIVDASVAVKWLVEEDRSDKARELFAREESIVAPALVIAEAGNALWKRRRMNIISAAHAAGAMQALPRYFARLFSLPELGPRALTIAAELDLPIYDCFYLALAERERLPMVSDDRRLLASAKRLRRMKVQKL